MTLWGVTGLRRAAAADWTKPDGSPGGSATASQTSDNSGTFWLFDSAEITDEIGTLELPCAIPQPPAVCVRSYIGKGGTLQTVADFSAFPSSY